MVAAATAVAWAVAMVQATEATRLRRGWRRRWRAVALAAAAAACGRVVFLFELTHADHSQHVRAVSTWFEPSRARCSATAAARLAAWVAGGGLDGGSGEMLSACAAAVAPSQRRTKAGLASILCERMRSGCCQHVCMLWHPPGSSRRAHLEEEVVAAREQQPAGPSQHVDPAGVHMPIVQHMHVHAASQSR